MQQKVRNEDLCVEKLPGDVNPSDLMTKPLDRPRILKLLSLMGIIGDDLSGVGVVGLDHND